MVESTLQVEDCGDECPIEKTSDVIEVRWTTLVIRELLPGKKRFSEIQRALNGISPKVLTARLRLLEAVLVAMAESGEQLSTEADQVQTVA